MTDPWAFGWDSLMTIATFLAVMVALIQSKMIIWFCWKVTISPNSVIVIGQLTHKVFNIEITNNGYSNLRISNCYISLGKPKKATQLLLFKPYAKFPIDVLSLETTCIPNEKKPIYEALKKEILEKSIEKKSIYIGINVGSRTLYRKTEYTIGSLVKDFKDID